MDDWQTIETAPKDGASVIVSNGKRVAIARWNTDPSVWEKSVEACWTVFEPEDYFYADHLVEPDEIPTHWMPLPDPPTQTK